MYDTQGEYEITTDERSRFKSFQEIPQGVFFEVENSPVLRLKIGEDKYISFLYSEILTFSVSLDFKTQYDGSNLIKRKCRVVDADITFKRK